MSFLFILSGGLRISLYNLLPGRKIQVFYGFETYLKLIFLFNIILDTTTLSRSRTLPSQTSSTKPSFLYMLGFFIIPYLTELEQRCEKRFKRITMYYYNIKYVLVFAFYYSFQIHGIATITNVVLLSIQIILEHCARDFI